MKKTGDFEWLLVPDGKCYDVGDHFLALFKLHSIPEYYC